MSSPRLDLNLSNSELVELLEKEKLNDSEKEELVRELVEERFDHNELLRLVGTETVSKGNEERIVTELRKRNEKLNSELEKHYETWILEQIELKDWKEVSHLDLEPYEEYDKSSFGDLGSRFDYAGEEDHWPNALTPALSSLDLIQAKIVCAVFALDNASPMQLNQINRCLASKWGLVEASTNYSVDRSSEEATEEWVEDQVESSLSVIRNRAVLRTIKIRHWAPISRENLMDCISSLLAGESVVSEDAEIISEAQECFFWEIFRGQPERWARKQERKEMEDAEV